MKKFKEIEMNGTEIMQALLLSVDEREGKGGVYCTLTLSDGETTEKANMWSVSKARLEPMIEQVVTVTVKVQEFNGRSYIVSKCVPAGPEYSILDFIRKTPETPEYYKDRILNICLETAGIESDLYRLVDSTYIRWEDELLKWSAAKFVHHSARGGLLQHTCAVVEHSRAIADVYPELDTGLICCASALHDIGKIRELVTSDLGDAEYTIEGNLFGHALLGIQMLDEIADTIGINKQSEEYVMLKHCVASHHGRIEFGAIKIPMTPEAYVVSMADQTDAKLYQYFEETDRLESGNVSEKLVYGLDTRVYKARVHNAAGVKTEQMTVEVETE